MSLDLSTAPEQRVNTVIPDGTFARMILNLRAGGTDAPGMSALDNGLFIASKSSDAIGLDCELTVTAGEHKGRKIFWWATIAGGALDEKGNSKGWNMTKPVLRAMVDSALGLDPKDVSPKAKTARMLEAFAHLNGIEFWAKIGVAGGDEILQDGQKTGRYYDPKNIIERVVVPGDAEYADLAAGKDVAPKPKGTAHLPSGPAAVAARPAWQKPATAPAANGPEAQPPLPVATGPAWLRK